MVRALLVVLFCVGSTQAEAPKKLLFIGTGPDGHPATTHEYMDGLKVLEQSLKGVKGIEITIVKAEGKWAQGPELIDRADGIVLFVAEGAKWVQLEETRLAALQRAAKRGVGLVGLHWGLGTKEAKYIDEYVKLLGGAHGGPDRKYKELETTVTPQHHHPIATGIEAFKIKDEFYYELKLVGPVGATKPVLSAAIDGKEHPVAWSWERPDGGRSFGFTGLHFHENWKRKEYRRLVAQGTLWTMKLLLPAQGLPLED
jgi:type 1 glutamine amidotransferase